MISRNASYVSAVALALLFAAPLSASIQAGVDTGDIIKLGNGVGSPGGIFAVYNPDAPGTVLFETFCVEITEAVNFTSKYVIEAIGTITNQGGRSMSSKTSWLYSSFLDGELNGFNPASVSDANALQLALWLSMGYNATDIGLHIGQSWYNLYNSRLTSKSWETDFNADVLGGWVDPGDVKIMNLRKLDSDGVTLTDHAQDQLVRITSPPPVAHTPEAASLIIWGVLVSCGVFAAGRRRS